MELKDLQNNDINQIAKNYRTALDNQYNAGVAALGQQRTNDFANIMSGSNKAGMMYSNFGQRSKTQYDNQTFTPTLVKTRQSYQTGIDKIRSNVADLYNNNKTIEEAIADLNEAIAELNKA